MRCLKSNGCWILLFSIQTAIWWVYRIPHPHGFQDLAGQNVMSNDICSRNPKNAGGGYTPQLEVGVWWCDQKNARIHRHRQENNTGHLASVVENHRKGVLDDPLVQWIFSTALVLFVVGCDPMHICFMWYSGSWSKNACSSFGSGSNIGYQWIMKCLIVFDCVWVSTIISPSILG